MEYDSIIQDNKGLLDNCDRDVEIPGYHVLIFDKDCWDAYIFG